MSVYAHVYVCRPMPLYIVYLCICWCILLVHRPVCFCVGSSCAIALSLPGSISLLLYKGYRTVPHSHCSELWLTPLRIPLHASRFVACLPLILVSHLPYSQSRNQNIIYIYTCTKYMYLNLHI